MTDVEIVSIGDELLRGLVADSNTHWIATRIAARGAALRRAVLVADDPPAVAAELKASLERAPGLIVTQGGLGPTDDDRTREAIALATGLALEPHAGAEAIVRRRYAELARSGAVADASLSEARARMTLLPRGALALDNEIGTAPAVVLDVAETIIVALPGVPAELQWIWANSLAPILDRVLGPGGFSERTVRLDLTDESRIAGLLARAAAAHPDVYVKSRAAGFREGNEIRVTLTARGQSDAAARALVGAAFGDLSRALAGEGIAVRD